LDKALLSKARRQLGRLAQNARMSKLVGMYRRTGLLDGYTIRVSPVIAALTTMYEDLYWALSMQIPIATVDLAVRGYQESIQPSGAYATRQTS
jgi:hypothetical protein